MDASDTLTYVYDIISEGIWDWHCGTGYVYRSPGWYRMLGYEVDCFEANVNTWEDVIHPDDYQRVMAHFEGYLQGRTEQYKIQYRCKKADKTYLWVEDSARIVERAEDGSPLRMIGAHNNIHEAKVAQQALRKQNDLLKNTNASLEEQINERTEQLMLLNQQLEKQMEEAQFHACHDGLTELLNRRSFEEKLSQEMNRARRYSQPMSLILLDIDDFKLINDDYGHKAGDQVLCQLAAFIVHHVREFDVVARWGGEEFAIILSNTSQSQAIHRAESLRQQIEGHTFEQNIKVTCSFGVTAYQEGDIEESIFARVDKALYRAKNNNRNNVQTL